MGVAKNSEEKNDTTMDTPEKGEKHHKIEEEKGR